MKNSAFAEFFIYVLCPSLTFASNVRDGGEVSGEREVSCRGKQSRVFSRDVENGGVLKQTNEKVVLIGRLFHLFVLCL